MNVLVLLATLAISSNVLVLRSGDRIVIADHLEQRDGRVIFRSASGGLFSIPIEEIDLAATMGQQAAPAPVARAAEVKPEPAATIPLKGSPEERKRLIAELEQNHGGTPPAEIHAQALAPTSPKNDNEEWSWRNRAHAYEEAVRQAKENLDLIRTRADDLRAHVESLAMQGYKANQFTYDAGQLQMVLDQVPGAELEVKRAERAYEEFRDEARKRNILPGWLR